MFRKIFTLIVLVAIPINSLVAVDIVSQEELEKSYQLSESWFLNSINKEGIFNYLYDAHENKFSDSNNAIRQLMASRLLAEMSSKDASLRDDHKRNLDFIFKHWVKEKQGLNFIVLYGKSKLGANAMMLRTLVASPFYDQYKERAEKFKKAVLYGINKDGSMNPFLIEPKYEYKWDYILTFYTGEALVALLEYYEKEKDPGLLKLIKKSQDFYIDRYVTKMDKNYYPAYVPWHSISLNMLYKITKDKKYSDAIFAMNDKLLEIQDRMHHVGRFYNPATPQYGTPHASSDGVYTEGLTYAYEIAKMLNDQTRMAIYKEALEIGFKHLISLQYNKNNSEHLPAPEKTLGAFRIRRTAPDASFTERTGSNVRIDSVQHTMDAFRKYFSLNSNT